MGRHRRGVVVAASLALTLIGVGPTAAETSMLLVNPTGQVLVGAEKYGEWSQPFEEGGAETPRCHRAQNTTLEDEIVCKPAAVSMAALPDGRIWYSNGLEGDENVRNGYVMDFGNRARPDLLRILDLSGPSPVWTKPNPETGGTANPEVKPGANWTNSDPRGVLGVPGRPGSGFVGTTWGKLGGPEGPNSAPPDDKPYSDRPTFCADVAQLADGRILVVGGTDYYGEPNLADRDEGAPADAGVVELEGLRSSRTFDWRTNSYTQHEPMKYGRWYPGLVTMPDGKVSVFSGVTKLIKSTQMGQVRRAELFDPDTGQWTEQYVNDQSETPLPLMPRLTLMPNGKILYNGSGQNFGPNGTDIEEAQFALQKLWDPQTKKWEVTGVALGGSRGAAYQILLPLKPPYDKGTVLLFGGTPLVPPPSGNLALNLSTVTTVTKDGRIENRLTKGQLHNRRWFSDGSILPDGTILATNGGDKDALETPGEEVPVHQAELYDPATDMWTPMASSHRDRVYHNTGMLLADGRVLVGGNSPVGTMYGPRRDQAYGVIGNNEKDASFEIFSPPYLFRGPRPEITYAPSGIAWDSDFSIKMSGGEEIGSIALIRLPSPEHVIDSDHRSVELAFTQEGKTLTAKAPPDGVIAPPGYYYLFVNKKTSKGLVPSVAAIVRVGEVISASDVDSSPAPIPLHDSTAAAKNGSATPDENSSMNDFGECTGCAKGERGGMRSDLQQTNPALKQVPIGADDDSPVQRISDSPPTIPSRLRLPSDRPRPMLVG